MTYLKIEMVIDLMCSWCPIGYRNLQAALDLLSCEITASVHFVPLQLIPRLSDDGLEIDTHLKRRTGCSEARLAQYKRDVAARADAVGLVYDDSKRTHYWNTLKAHCLLNAAAPLSKHTQLFEALQRAYFEHGKNIGQSEVLVEIGASVGLDRLFVLDALWSAENREDVRRKERRARYDLDVRSLPTVLIDDRVKISSSRSADYFIDTLRDIARNRSAVPSKAA